MIANRYNTQYLKKVDPITSAFDYKNPLKEGFPNLPLSSIVIPDTLVDKYDGVNQRAFMHQSTLGSKNGVYYCAYSVHRSDEDSSGMNVQISYSTDQGKNWTLIGQACPQMSVMADHGTFPAQWSYPSCFIDIPSGYYLLISAVDGLSELENYNPLGVLVRKINQDNTLGSLEWVNNGQGNSSRIVPTPISGFPSYNFASEQIINEVFTYISQPMYKPKILFGWEEVWSTQENLLINSSVKLREPTEIRPYNYKQTIKCWKSFQVQTNIFQIEEDNTTQVITNIPDGNPTARRWINYSPEIIISIGNTKDLQRQELGLMVWRKNNRTGVYEVNSGDSYSLTDNPKSGPVLEGFAKGGGEQLPYILRVGKNLLSVCFSVSKEEIYFKTIDISKLL